MGEGCSYSYSYSSVTTPDAGTVAQSEQQYADSSGRAKTEVGREINNKGVTTTWNTTGAGAGGRPNTTETQTLKGVSDVASFDEMWDRNAQRYQFPRLLSSECGTRPQLRQEQHQQQSQSQLAASAEAGEKFKIDAAL